MSKLIIIILFVLAYYGNAVNHWGLSKDKTVIQPQVRLLSFLGYVWANMYSQ